MRPELQAYLDGEISLLELPAELHAEAERWERLVAEARKLGPQAAPADLEARILAALPQHRPKTTVHRLAAWATRPRTVRVSPLAGLAAAAAIAFLIFWPRGAAPPPAAGPDDATVYVQFVLEAPEAHSVAVAGDFNGWSPQVVLSDADGDGIWTGRVALKPGVHQYMFVIDETQWMTDPQADRYTDDGFGNRNAVLVLTEPAARS
ncbi:MAG: glycoside hydrolase family 13 [Gemmatimonadota bacterium]|nr:MAG: glycoside hydrolase family 13 [Gemmatimonadota bacterium]